MKPGDDPDDKTTERAELVHASKAWMLGPKAENQDLFERLFLEVFRDCCYWRRNFHPEDDPFVTLADRRSLGFQRSQEVLREQLGQMIARLKSGVPFFNPRYVGHMLTDQFIAGFLGYAAAMFHNQNTLAHELAPVTLEFEGEAMQLIGTMLGLDSEKAWGHLCCGGTTANMEALWVARNLRLFPYLLRAAVDQLSGSAEPPDQTRHQTLRSLSARGKPFVDWSDTEQLRTLTVDELLNLRKQLKEACSNDIDLAAFMQKWSPVRLGMVNTLAEWVGKQLAGMELKHLEDGLFPRFKIIIGKNAHYSLLKAIGLIGFGEADVIQIDVDPETMRMDLGALSAALDECDRRKQCVMAVVAVYGTTEVAAVDPFAGLIQLRDERRAAGVNADFWIHADACYGGYACTMLPRCNNQGTLINNDRTVSGFLQELARQTKATKNLPDETWNNTRLTAWTTHTKALRKCESISIDPHKLGYIPYPAGAILYRDKVARELIRYEAPYLNEAEQKAIQREDQEDEAPYDSKGYLLEAQAENIRQRVPWYEGKMSEYTLEGSRPGASAAAVWLARKTIPLNQEGHGAMVGQTVLGTWRLIETLRDTLRVQTDKDGVGCALLCEKPDLNIVCYTFPARIGGRSVPLAVINQAVRKLYDEFLPDSRHPMPTRDFVIAKTALGFTKYGQKLGRTWERLCRSAGLEPEGSLVAADKLKTAANPWLDDSEVVLVRTAIMGSFFLNAQTTHGGRGLDLATHYADTLKRTLYRLMLDILNSPLPRNRRPRLPAPVLVLEDEPLDRDAMLEQLLGGSVDFDADRDTVRHSADADDAAGFVDRQRIRAALVDIRLSDTALQGGKRFLENMIEVDRPFFWGAVVFTSIEIELEQLRQRYRDKGKLLLLRRKPKRGTRRYQEMMNLVLADLWQILHHKRDVQVASS